MAAMSVFRVPYSQRYLFNAIPNTNHTANPTNPNRNGRGNPNPNTSYRCEYVILNSDIEASIVICGRKWRTVQGKSSESVQCAMLKACGACADMGQL